MAKKTTLAEIGETLAFIVKRMATKEDVREMLRPLDIKLAAVDTRLTSVESKLAGIDKRLDIDAVKRDHHNMPTRLADVEKEVFGKSRAPQHPAM